VITSLRGKDGRLRGFAKLVRDETEPVRSRDRRVQLEDRTVMERNLLDEVIQQLFQTGLLLHGAVRWQPSENRDRVLDAIGQLDATISHIRLAVGGRHDSRPRPAW
jgi:hypothetical protein